MRKTYSIPIIAITGSAGKTTTKECIAGILNTKWNIVKTHKNNNLPSSTMKNRNKITTLTQAAVLEYAMGLPSDIVKHCKILPPSISVITNIGSAHIGLSKSSVERLARNKSNIILGMKPDGLLLYNADDENSKHLLINSHKGKLISISIDTPSDYQARNVEIYEKGSKFEVELQGKTHTFYINLLGKHNIYNALFAIAVADYLGFSIDEMKQGLDAAYKLHLRYASRLSVYEFKDNITLIDDTKNSNPHACRAAVDAIKKIKKEKYIVVLGDMLHLGALTKQGHYEVGQYLAENNIDQVIAYGKYGKYIAKGAKESGMKREQIKCFKHRRNLNLYVKSSITSNSIVLVKGSGSINMKQTVSFIKSKLNRIY